MTRSLSACIRNSFVYLFLAVPFLQAMQAQTAHFSGVFSIIGSGFSQPYGVAVDGSGNVFVADTQHSAVKEIVAVNGSVSSSSTVNEVGSGFSSPYGVAVDSSGNIFVADTNNNAVKEIVAVNGSVSSSSTVNTVGSGFSGPQSVAVDSAGNVFVADFNNNAVKEIIAVNGAVSSGSTVNTIGSGFFYAAGVAVDGAGNVFVADTNNGAVKEIIAVSGSVSSSSTVNTVGSGFQYPGGVAVDSAGNVFVGDTGNGAVKEIVAVNGAVSSSSTVNTVGSGFLHPYGVAVDGAGSVYLADYANNAVEEIMIRSANFGSLPVATTAPTTLSLTFTFATAGTIGAPAVLTQGATGLDFTSAGTGTCTTNGTSHSYSAGDTCTVDVTFTPKLSGVRYGAATLSSSGVTIATGNVHGTGVGPQVLFPPGTVRTVGSGFSSAPYGVAVDGAGNVFAANYGNNTVYEIVAVNGLVSSTSTVITVGSGFTAPYGVAVDGAGNVFVGSNGDSTVKEIVAVNGLVSPTSTINTIGNGFNSPTGVAVDGSGNVFVADSANQAVKEIQAVNGVVSSNSIVVTVGSGFSYPRAVALDGAGDVFVADTLNNAVKEIVAVNGVVSSSSTVVTIGSGFAYPYGVAVDSSGNVFVGDFLNDAVKEIVAVNGVVSSSSTVVTLGSGFNHPKGVAVNSSGNVFVADTLNIAVKEIDRAAPPSLTFASTLVGLTSSDSPQAVTIENTGNATLTFEVPVAGLNPSVSNYFTFGNSSTCTQLSTSSTTATLAAGASCTELISFTPTASGSITGSLLTTDNVLNAVGPTYATQSIALSGIATEPVTAITAVASAALTQNHTSTSFIPVTGSGGTGTLTYSVYPALPAGLTLSATGVISGTPTVVRAATIYTVTITDTNSATSTANFSLTVNPAIVATAASSSTILTQNHAAAAFTPVTAAGGTGTLTYSISPALPSGLVFSAAGAVSGTPNMSSVATTYRVTVTDANGATATATFSLSVNSSVTTPTSTTVASSSLTPTYGASVVLTATVTPAPAVTPMGTVSFYTGRTLLGTVALNSTGAATLSITLPLGPNTITAVYSGNAGDAGSTSSALSVSNRTGSSVTFAASPITQLYNNPIVLTAQATSPTAGTLTGTVSFLDGSTVIGTVPLGANGHATYAVTTLADGSHSLTAAYSGDGSFQASGSTGTAIAITVGNINLNLGGDQNKSVIPGAAVAYTFPLSPLVTPTFLYEVHLTATGLPAGATYQFSPALIPAGSASLPVTLTVQTAKGTASLSMPAGPGQQNSSRGLTALAFGLLLPLLGAKQVRRRLKVMPGPLAILFVVLSLGAMVGMTGCGSGGFYGATSTTGKYTITITATSADLVRVSTVQLTIQ